MVDNPGGDWHPGRGPLTMYTSNFFTVHTPGPVALLYPVPLACSLLHWGNAIAP